MQLSLFGFFLTVSYVEKRRAEYGRAQEPQEYRGRYEIVGHILPTHFSKPFSEYAEAFSKFRREMSMACQDPTPGELDRSSQVLLLLL